ncbi:MAG TPA: hypothetical protein VGJ95_16550 [Pseudonocardiaceae bacterium]
MSGDEVDDLTFAEQRGYLRFMHKQQGRGPRVDDDGDGQPRR